MSPARRALAWAVCAGVICVSYAVQRVWDAQNEPPPGTLFLQAHTPYYWRMSLAALHGVCAGLLAGFGTDEALAERALRRAPEALALAVGAAALAMVLVP